MADENVNPEIPNEPTPADPSVADPNPVDPVDPAPSEGDPAPTDITPGEPSQPAHTSDLKLSGIEFDGALVDVDIPMDMANFCADAGIDVEAVAKEIYSPDGLSEATRESLNTAFGKWQVDAYLSGLEAKNAQTMAQFKTDQEAATKAAEDAWNATMEIMGGEDRWDALDAYAASTLSESEIEEFNAVMKNGSLYMQQLMIKDLWSKYEAAGKPDAPVKLDLEGGDNTPPSDTSGAITQAEYLEAFRNGEYRKDPAAWDERRKAGMAKGI